MKHFIDKIFCKDEWIKNDKMVLKDLASQSRKRQLKYSLK